MKLSSLDDDQVEIMQDDKSFLLKIKENKTVIPNVDLEFLFQRTASQSMVPTISKGGYRDEIPANVFQQTKLEVQHFPIVGHRQFMLPIKDIDRRTKKVLFFLLVDGNPTMKGGKLELLRDTFSHIIDFLPEDSYLMIGKFGSGCEWLTPKPQLCGTSQKPVFRGLFSKVQQPPETRSETTLVSLFQTAYMVDYPEVDFPRSVIVLSNGNFSNQKQIEQVLCELVATESKHSVRISSQSRSVGWMSESIISAASESEAVLQIASYEQ